MGHPVDLPAGPGTIDFLFESLPLFDGAYDVVVGVSGVGGMLYDWQEPACKFEVMNPGRSTGVVAMPLRVAIVPRERVDESVDPSAWVDPAGAGR